MADAAIKKAEMEIENVKIGVEIKDDIPELPKTPYIEIILKK